MATVTLPLSSAFSYDVPSKRSMVSAPPLRKNSVRCKAERTPSSAESNSDSNFSNNLLVKLAWYASEALGIAASVFRPSAAQSLPQQSVQEDEVTGPIPRNTVVDAIKKDYERSYFVTGNLTMAIYEEDCEFADPAGSFKGLRRFKRNCSNFGSLLEKSDMKLMDWKHLEDKGVGYWRFICILAFPSRPILSATGYTEYYYDAKSGKIYRHVEHWNVPKMALLKQIFKPNRRLWKMRKDYNGMMHISYGSQIQPSMLLHMKCPTLL